MDKVSIVIPAYNAEKHILQCVESILNQTYPDIEIIVVDDGSTDATAEVLKPHLDRIIYHRQRNQGAATARNTGISLATGEYIGFLDHDDYYLDENKTAEQVLLLETNPDWDGVHSGWQIFSETGEPRRHVKPWKHMPEFTVEAWFQYSPVFLQTMLIRRSCFDKVMFPELKTSEDTYFIGQLLLEGCKIGWHRKVTTAYRFVSTSKTHKDPYFHSERAMQVWKDLLALPGLPESINPRDILYSKLIWMLFNLISQGATERLGGFLQEIETVSPYVGTKTPYDVIAQLTKILHMNDQSRDGLADIFADYIPQPDLLNWWYKVWWWYYLNYQSTGDLLTPYHHDVVQALADFSRQERIALAQQSLYIMIWIGLGYGEGWNVMTMIRRFSRDANINWIRLYAAVLYMSIRYRNWRFLR